MFIHNLTGCSTPPPGPPPRATAADVHINRVSVLSGRVVSAYLKRPPEGTTPEELRPQWSFEQTHVLPQAVVSTAREAARRIGLDYGGIDVVEDLRTGRVLCLEANAAPGMSPETLRNLYAQIQQTVRGRTARAS